jgi:phage terminase large subunit-like protein
MKFWIELIMRFEKKKAQDAIDFFEKRLRHAVGRFAGHPFKLAPWERRIVSDVFGTMNDDGFRQYRTLFLSTSKKSGKTALAAGLALQGLTSDRESEPHVYSAGSVRDQAALAFNAARSMVAKSTKLRARCLVRPGVKRILYPSNSGFYAAISADAGSHDGIQPSRFIADEIHRWASNRDLWDILDKGTSVRQQPLGVAISTAGIFGESELCWEFFETCRQVNEDVISLPTFYGRIFATPLDWNWTDPGEPAKYDTHGDVVRPATGWYAANPALGDFLPIDKLIEECKEAKSSPQKEQSFKRFRLNQWVQHEQRWIDLRKWDACKSDVDAEALSGQQCHAGLDLSTRKDLSALVLVFPQENGHFKILPFYWLPKEYDVNRAMLDRVRPWIAAGKIETTEGPVIDFGRIRARINELGQKYRIQSISFDPFNASSLVQDLTSDGFEMFEVRQGFLSLSEPTKQFEALILEKRIEHDGNQVFRWNVDCCAIKSDNKDNIFPLKPHREKSNKRIDGVLAAIMGLDHCVRHAAPKKESIYESRGMLGMRMP